ncbi:hypothetical protein PVAP13_3NG210071 [Panicum virgatum]|uniref:Uncharacterized protein n=1 Tax=Panicum virgatum TaxID=38727 RepID=A0A8T0UD68_PANVG|nr:hypothetical protein PVAP13_3NG210071 [Panicum virgatum]
MSHRSSREVAPVPHAPAAGVPWWGAAVKPNISYLASGQAMTPPRGWWRAPMPQNNSFISPYGPWI